MGRRLTAVIGLVIVGLLAGGARAGDTLQKIRETGVLRVGVPYEVPPFGFFDPETGGLAGYDIDAAQALADELGVRLKLKPVDHRTKIPALVNNQVDLVAATLAPHSDLGKIIAFSEVYLTTGVGFIAKAGSVRGLNDLQGKKIAVGKDTVAEFAVEHDISGASVVAFDDLYPALEALQSGEVAAGAGDSSILPALLPMLPKGEFEVLPFQIAEIPYVVGVRRNDKELLDFVNQTIKEKKASGNLDQLYAKWFQPEPEEEEGPAAAAAAVISRKAFTRPRYVAVILRGDFETDAEVSVFSTDGDFVCTATVASVFAEEIYVDVDPDKYEEVRSGYAVGMHVKSREAAREAIMEHQDVLKDVKQQEEADTAAVRAEIDAEAKAKEQRQVEADEEKYKNSLVRGTIRTRDRDNRYYYGGYRGRYYRGRRYYR